MLDKAGRKLSSLTFRPQGASLRGRLRVPGDKSISHRCLLLAALAAGTSRITGLSAGLDVQATRRAVASFGATVVPGANDGEWAVTGGKLGEPDDVIDVGNSGTAIRLMVGWAAAIEALTVLKGDRSIARRPMGRVVEPIRSMGATLDGRGNGSLPPLVVRGGHLHGIDYELPVPSAQVKGAILLAGVSAEGETTVRERHPTRVHTEEMLPLWGGQVRVGEGSVTVTPGPLSPCDFDVPGDPSQAAFWIVAACITPGSDLTVEDVYLGPQRAGFLAVLERMGANVEVARFDDRRQVGDVRAAFGPLLATQVGGAEIPGLIDEIPVLAVAAAFAEGATVFSDAGELRHKESDRVESTVGALRTLGATAEGRPDGLFVEGSAGASLKGGIVDSEGDHRVAMSMAVASLRSAAPVTIDAWESVATSYPGFEEDFAICTSNPTS